MPSESQWERYDRDGDVNEAAQKETANPFERWTTCDLSALLFCEHDESNDVGLMERGTKNAH